MPVDPPLNPAAGADSPSVSTAPKTMPAPLELQRRYLTVKTADVNAALSLMHEETLLLDLRIKPLRRGMKCAGLAITWNAVLACHDPIPRETEPVKNWRQIQDCVYPGCVLVYQPGGEMSSGHLGSMYSNMLAARGAMGAIVDGNLRDSDGHERIRNWHPFGRNTSPLEAMPHIKWLEANTPILMSGELRRYVTVTPGDFVLADGDGVVIVPPRLVLPALLKAEEVCVKEERAERRFAAGEDPWQVMKQDGVG